MLIKNLDLNFDILTQFSPETPAPQTIHQNVYKIFELLQWSFHIFLPKSTWWYCEHCRHLSVSSWRSSLIWVYNGSLGTFVEIMFKTVEFLLLHEAPTFTSSAFCINLGNLDSSPCSSLSRGCIPWNVIFFLHKNSTEGGVSPVSTMSQNQAKPENLRNVYRIYLAIRRGFPLPRMTTNN